jgi:hypothetical protein
LLLSALKAHKHSLKEGHAWVECGQKKIGGAKPADLFVRYGTVLSQQEAWLPSNALRRSAKFFECSVLNLTYTLFADSQQMANLPKAMSSTSSEAKAQIQNLPFPWAKILHEEMQRFLPFGVLPERCALVIRHCFG